MAKNDILIERGKRLQSIRRKTGLTRLEFAQKTGISPNTLKALELAERELTPQKALLFSNLFSGLFSVTLGEDAHITSFDFLYYGKKCEHPGKMKLIKDNDDERLQNEIGFFETNPAYMLLKIPDNFMSPFYNKGDIVVGKRIVNKREFSNYVGHNCILEDINGDRFLRRIIKSDGQKITSLQNTKVIEEKEIRAIAHAMWHLHLSEAVRNLSIK